MGVNHVNKGRLDSQHLSETFCGGGSCKPSWFHIFANPKSFTFIGALIFGAKVAYFMYFAGIIATIERRFQLSSSESGTLTIINDVAELSIAMFVSYFGHTGHRPRWIAIGTILWGIGTLICALPHFLSDPLDPNAVISGTFGNQILINNDDDFDFCQNYDNASTNEVRNSSTSGQCTEESEGLGPVKWIIVGQILSGLGAAPFYSLMISYIDDCVGKFELVSYTASLFVANTLGASFGYLLSSYATSLYVDFDRIPSRDIPDIPQHDPRWIGAWWLGFVIIGVFALITPLPLLFFPKKMTKHLNSTQEEEKETLNHEKSINTNSDDKECAPSGLAINLLGILKALKRLLSNIPLMFMCLAAGCEAAISAIMGTFGIKSLQLQFTISPTLAAGILGGLLLPSNISSQVLSAYICRRWKLGIRGCARMILISTTLGFVTYPILMFVGCQNFNIAGVNADYSTLPIQNVNDEQQRSIIHSCNHNCGCDEDLFRPVCGSDGITYISPCHAGCEAIISDNTSQEIIYADCQCIVNRTNIETQGLGTAASGLCLDCGIVMFSIAVVFILSGVFAMYMIANPMLSMTMRIVAEEDRSVVTAFQGVFAKCFGYFPAPILLGTIINSTCIYWQRSCGNRGSCWLYDIVRYRYAYYGTISALRCCTIFCWIMINKYVSSEQSEIVKDKKEIQRAKEYGNDRWIESPAKEIEQPSQATKCRDDKEPHSTDCYASDEKEIESKC